MGQIITEMNESHCPDCETGSRGAEGPDNGRAVSILSLYTNIKMCLVWIIKQENYVLYYYDLKVRKI